MPAPIRLQSSAKPLYLGDVRKVREGASVYSVGYPMPEILGSRAKINQGIINSTAGFQNDMRMFQVSIPAQPGNSGSPLLNSKGEVIGVISAQLGLEFTEYTGVLTQNVNYAVTLSTYCLTT